ncbi:hypothetical protein LCGC14_1224660 [marine sediment metagenome]|uniref:Uncharacterized protein n=1 Tax=marine sediment metagenome TaxID=412755 RepID=A0A0F9PEQ0_9ZZZZ
MSWRWITQRCVFCGNKKKSYRHPYGILYCCPTDISDLDMAHPQWGNDRCSTKKKFLKRKEAKVQRALGLLSGPTLQEIFARPKL